jgi:hypothetical protein
MKKIGKSDDGLLPQEHIEGLADSKSSKSVSNIISAAMTIRGERVLLWHHFGQNGLPLEKREKEGVAGNDPSEWKRTVLVTRKGQLYLEPEAVFSCMRDAAKYTRKGKFSIQGAVAATLQVDDARVLIDRFLPKSRLTTDREKPVYLDVRGVRNPNTRNRNIRYRIGASPGWKATIHLTWDKTIVSRSEMQAVAIDAGRLVGLGDGRAIGNGRFEIKSFSVGNYAKKPRSAVKSKASVSRGRAVKRS